MEAYTFTDPGVQAALADFVLLKADVTANHELDQALMQRFGIIGPPATMFFNVKPQERRGLRRVGPEKADPSAERERLAAEPQSLVHVHNAVQENSPCGRNAFG